MFISVIKTMHIILSFDQEKNIKSLTNQLFYSLFDEEFTTVISLLLWIMIKLPYSHRIGYCPHTIQIVYSCSNNNSKLESSV